MSKNLEIEVKAIINKEEYNALLKTYSRYKNYEQTNYYIDDKSLSIRKKKCGLRIREKCGDFELTLKYPFEDGKMEINQSISQKIFENCRDNNLFPAGEVSDYLTKELGIDINSLSMLGSLITFRCDIPYKTSLISIDRSLYNFREDFEIEVEDNSKEIAKKHLQEFLKKNGIEYRKSQGSKLKRFLDSLNLS